MPSPVVTASTALGFGVLAAGLWTYRRDTTAQSWRDGGSWVFLGPVFVAAALAAFSGEHFTVAKFIQNVVPKFMPARLFIAYFVGVAELAAALSYIARRCLKWSSLGVGIMFTLFVLLMDLPATLRDPHNHLSWVLMVRQGTFAMGGYALFARQIGARPLAYVASLFAGSVTIFYGVQHLLHPEISPGVPDSKLTDAWVPAPHLLAYLVGALLILLGIGMLLRKYAYRSGALAGLVMLALTIVLYVPEYFAAHNTSQYVNAINFIFDTMLFAGTLLVIASANRSQRFSVSTAYNS